MIKINLLQSRKVAKRAGIHKEFVVLIVSVVLLLACLAAVHWKMSSDLEETTFRITKTREEIALYKIRIAEANKAKEAQKALQAQLDVINLLRKEKGSAAKVLDELSTTKPEKMHFDSLKKDGNRLGIEGIALDDETIANFMTSLRKSKLFKNVDLVVSEQIEQSKVKLRKFTLSCEISVM